MKSNNIIMGVLVAVIAVMGVAFAAFSTTLTIEGTATIASSWDIDYAAGTCTPAKSTDKGGAVSSGTVSVNSQTGAVEVNVDMVSPGDILNCTVVVTNNSQGLSAIRKSWAITSAVSDTNSYVVTAEADTAAAIAPNGSETLTVKIQYNNVTAKPADGATFTAQAVYGQAGVQ